MHMRFFNLKEKNGKVIKIALLSFNEEFYVFHKGRLVPGLIRYDEVTGNVAQVKWLRHYQINDLIFEIIKNKNSKLPDLITPTNIMIKPNHIMNFLFNFPTLIIIFYSIITIFCLLLK